MSNTQIKEPDADTSFDLTGLAEIAEKAGVDVAASPDAATAAAIADADKLAEEELQKKEAAAAEGGEAVETDEQKAARLFAEADAKKAAEEAAAAGEPSEEEKAAAEAAKAEADAKAAEATAKKAQTAADDAETVHMRPSQKKAWNAMKAEREAARAEAAAAKAEADAAKARIAEVEAASQNAVIPEALKKETEELRQRVRELDAERDPEIVKKYDTPIKRNEDAVVEILKKWKFDKIADDKGNLSDNPEAIPALLKAGVSFGTLSKQITALEKAGAVDDAEAMREFLRENIRLRRDKGVEVQAIKSDVEGRMKARQAQGNQQAEETTKAVLGESQRILTEEIGAIAKKHTFLARPEILATDTPAQIAAKKTAIAEHEAVEKKVGEVAKSISTIGKSGRDYVNAEGRKTALAIESVVLRDRVLPRLEADLSKAHARIKELETELGKTKSAGAISRAHGAAAQAGSKGAKMPDASVPLGDALKEFAASQGVTVNS